MSATDQHLTRNFYDRISNVYDSLADANEHTAREKGLQLLAVQPGESVLEIGFGTGHSLVALAEAAGPRGSIAGVDISEGMKKVARHRVDQAGVGDRVELHTAAVPPLPFEDASFDAVSMSFTLELFPLDVIPQVLAEIRRCLRPAGRLGVTAMSLAAGNASDSFLEKSYKWMHQHFPHIVDCQPIHARRFLQQAGFKVSQEERMEIWTMPVVALVGLKSREAV
jgi:demethylmenaquinone methyltransferase/2-methoxy-6-polyprenyl-1,4-benzoquinol methylase